MSTAPDLKSLARIEQQPLSRVQIQVIGLCALVAMLDGFDTQLIAFVAPAIASAWKVPPASFGGVFAAGLLGLMLGAAGLGSLADRVGRKRVIVLSCALFGVFALLTAFAQSLISLIVLRFLTGVGLGGAMPNIIALTAEHAPQRSRGRLVTLMFCGFPLGAVIGGPLSASLIESFGWRSVFVLGGVLPLALIPVLIRKLPQSPPAAPQDPLIQNAAAVRSPIAYLFAERRALVTLLLWVVFFSNLLILYSLINWLPVILQRAGFALDQAIIGTVLLNAGGIVGGLTLGRLIDWRGPYWVLIGAYIAAALAITVTGHFNQHFGLTSMLIFLSGFCVMGAQFGANSLAANLYPTAARATGLGWALGVGRIGAIIGPLLGSLVIAMNWPLDQIFLASAAPAILAAAAVFSILLARAAR